VQLRTVIRWEMGDSRPTGAAAVALRAALYSPLRAKL
jgi:DNA-binding transcriptional regulator YiaG